MPYRSAVRDWGHPDWGTEFDWLAVDEAGEVAVFSSAGYGPVPLAVMAIAGMLNDEYEKLRCLPVVSPCAEHPEGPGNYADWIRFAEGGLYGFDWRLWDGPYVRLTAPGEPLRFDDLPRELAELASVVRLPLKFAGAASVDLGTCGISIARAGP